MGGLIDTALRRSSEFCEAYKLQAPILMAPMAGACPPALAAAIARAGGMGGCGSLLMNRTAIEQWVADFRATSDGPFQLNLWVPDPAPARDANHERVVADFLAVWDRSPEELSTEPAAPFDEQCEALIAAGPTAISSIMGLYPPDVVSRIKANGIRWFSTVTTVDEARQAEDAGADAIVAQGSEAGGHRGTFEADAANVQSCGLMALLPAVCDAVRVPVIATGGIADARGIVAALSLGASAVQIGTAFLRAPEAAIPQAWADAIGVAQPEDTELTRAFSGRLGRSLRTSYVAAAERSDAPHPLPYPLQRAATAPMRSRGTKENDLSRIQAWAGQSARLAKAAPAGEILAAMWAETKAAMSR